MTRRIPSPNFIYRPLVRRTGLFLVSLLGACFAHLQTARAVNPPPDGGYPGGNTAEGQGALLNFVAGGYNTAVGFLSLRGNTTGSLNTAIGAATLLANTANNNTAIGTGALLTNTTGNNNIALGTTAGSNLTTGDNNIDIGNAGVAAESNTIRIGDDAVHVATWIGGISNHATGPLTVKISTDGRLGIQASSARFKNEIQPVNDASEAILALRPVSFRYKKEVDSDRARQFGLIAEDVAKVNPDLVIRGRDGKPFAVRYEAVNTMLLNEFLKEHRKVDQQQKQIDALTAQLKEQAAQIQKVSAQLQISKAEPQSVFNSQ